MTKNILTANILTTVVVGLILVCITSYTLGSSGNYNGYTVYYDAENQKGFVYKNDAASSALVVGYPSTNEGYMYSAEGQTPIFLDKFLFIIAHPTNSVRRDVVAVISSGNGTQ